MYLKRASASELVTVRFGVRGWVPRVRGLRARIAEGCVDTASEGNCRNERRKHKVVPWGVGAAEF